MRALRSKVLKLPQAPSREDLLGSLVHEVGNLLAGLRLSVHLLRGDLAASETGTMAEEAERLTVLAGALVAASRPLLGELPGHQVSISPGALLAGAARSIEEVLLPGSKLRVGRGRGLPHVRADPEAVHHLLVLLAAGAASEAAPRPLSLRLLASEQGRRVILSVVDDGPALARSKPARPGRRGRELWFSVADQVLRAGGGRLQVVLQPRGTRVDLLLPALPAGGGGGRRQARERGCS